MGILEDAYRAVLDGATDAIYVTDMDYNLLYANRKAQKIGEKLTASVLENTGKCYQYFQGLDHPCPHCKIAQMSSEKYLVRTREEKGGTLYELRGKLITWEGKIAHVEYIQNLSESEHLFRSVLSSMKGGIAVYQMDANEQFRLVDYSEGFPVMQGYSIREYEEFEDIYQKDAFFMCHPVDEKRVKLDMRNTFREQQQISTSFRIRHRNGDYIWVHFAAFPDGESMNGRIRYNAVITNASHEFELFQKMLDVVEAGLIVTDQETDEIYYTNRSADRVLDEAKRLCSHTQGCQIGSKEKCTLCDISALKPQAGVEQRKQKIAEKTYQIYMHPIQWMGREAVAQYLSDLSEEVRLQNQLVEALREAEEASRVKSVFLSNMSHEIRTPMNIIMGLTELAEDEIRGNQKARSYLEKIEQSSQYLLGILNDILEMSRIDSGKAKLDCDWHTPADVVTPVLDMMAPMMKKKGITFSFSQNIAQITDFECYIDAQKIQQLLMNLLNNAWKFTPPGGKVSFSSRNVSLDRANQTAVDAIVVKDSGCGMTRDFLEHRIFSPFEQERLDGMEDIPGTGLGLAISQNVVEQMGGRIDVESEPGKGATFTVLYPYSYRSSTRQVSAPDTRGEDFAEIVGRRKLRVLLAEDNEINTMIVTCLLEKYGIQVESTKNGKEAADLFEGSPSGTYDFILMDIRMPVMDGLEATRRIRSMERADATEVPIIAMSANAYESDRKRSMEAGMNEHLAKPLDSDTLFQTMERFYKKRMLQGTEGRCER